VVFLSTFRKILEQYLKLGHNHVHSLSLQLSHHTEWILGGTRCEGVDWIHVAQDRDQRQALVNTVMNL
jgi:hypothetical protein